jgi:hypothetical protein
MAEHWDMFFQSTKPKEVSRGGATLATTTDTRQALNDAVSDRRRRDAETTSIYTEVRGGVTEQDGGTEHSAPIVRTDGPEPKDPAELLDYMATPLSPEQDAQIRAGWQQQVIAARAALPDWDDVVDQNADIPSIASEMIRRVPNGSLVAYHLGLHRTELDELCRMKPKAIEQRIVELSDALMVNPVGVALDKTPYRAYRKIRNEQVRNAYR